MVVRRQYRRTGNGCCPWQSSLQISRRKSREAISIYDEYNSLEEGSEELIIAKKVQVGVTDERNAADLNDMDGREILTEEHLDRIKEIVSNYECY